MRVIISIFLKKIHQNLAEYYLGITFSNVLLLKPEERPKYTFEYKFR